MAESLAQLILDGRHPPEMLYHYTSAAAFESIMSDQGGPRFLCTNYQFLNDTAEFEEGLSVIRQCVQKREGDKCVSDAVLKALKDCADINKWCFSPWVLSFSSERDSTIQWAAYSDRQKGGLAIGLDYQDLADKILTADSKLRDQDRSQDGQSVAGIFLAPCIYHNSSQRDQFTVRVNLLVDHILGKRESFWHLRGSDLPKYADYCARQLIKIAALIKRDDFAFENEWRVILTPGNVLGKRVNGCFGKVCLVGGKPRLSIRRSLGRKLVKEVVIGPHGDRLYNHAVARVLLETMRFDGKRFHYEINQSQSSYNGR